MSSTKHLALGAAGVVAALTLVAVFIIGPNYRKAAAIRTQMLELQAKVDRLGRQSQELADLRTAVAASRRRVDAELKLIPEVPDLASLFRKLSQSVDRVRVLDQTFTAGSTGEAIAGGKTAVLALPLTVDMESTFDSVFALIQNAESLDRLVRVSSVRIGRKAEEKEFAGPPIVKATVNQEAIFEPPGTASGPTSGGGR